MTITTIGIFPNKTLTEKVIHELRASGISDTEISSIYKDENANLKDEQTVEKVESGTATGAAAGAIVGALAGLVVANGILPGLGSVFVAGPLLGNLFGLSAAAATTAGGAVTGAIAGGLAGGLIKLGVSEEDAKIYESSLQEGQIVMITRTDVSGVKDIFESYDAREIREYENL